MKHLASGSVARATALPLGGIGTGSVAIAADGGLRQWQLHNIGNHRGDLPYSFFAVRVQRPEPPLNDLRVLQTSRPDASAVSPAPLVTDHERPAWQDDLVETFGGVRATEFSGCYPFATVDYDMDGPVDLRMQAFSPLIPLDVDRSSIPTAMFTFTLTNSSTDPVTAWLGACVQNAVGHDGTSMPDGVHAPGYGGNITRVTRDGEWTSLVMENPALAPSDAGAGQMVLTCDSPTAAALPQWTDPADFMSFLQARAPVAEEPRLSFAPTLPDHQPGARSEVHGASAPGHTWNGGVCAPMQIEPGGTGTVRVALTWNFPNRYVNFPQFGSPDPRWGPTKFWLGNHYSTLYDDAEAVARRVQQEWTALERDSRSWTDLLEHAGLDDTLGDRATEHMAAQAVVLRSPTCFRTADGAFYAFEGINGASTLGHAGDVGGSCPLNCTHVWNYAHALAALFPELERSMRDTEFDVLQAPDGSVPHRVIAPAYLPQFRDRPIGGPEQPALDGMLGVVLKSYRDVRNGTADRAWLARRLPQLWQLFAHVREIWDPDATGVLHGIQPSTHDIDLHGVNPFMGTYWLAALRALEEMASLSGEDHRATALHDLFDRAAQGYDEQLFNGEYYVQVLEPGEDDTFQWGPGCLADQLIGQWWAHELGLGHLLPADHVRSALRAIVRHNLRTGFRGFEHPFRRFADEDDTGLLVCTWPEGGRPDTPIRYADEVWTGTEQQVAAHCLREGLRDEAHAILDGLRDRYDGTRRNPYNHIECGDHYVRSLSGWTVLNAVTDRFWDATSGELTLRRPGPGERVPILTATGWGYAHRENDGTTDLVTLYGDLGIHTLTEVLPV